MLPSIKIDTHTHTVLSGHAWSTLKENALAAASLGLDGICLTEHGPEMPGSGAYFMVAAQKMLPRTVEGIRVYSGAEANIVNFDGTLDIDDRMLAGCEFAIASLHDITIRSGTVERNTAGMIGALANPVVDILAHIDDRKMPVDFEEVVKSAASLGKLIEINNNSLLVRKGSRERVREVAELCAKHSVRVSVASDAHFYTMIGQVSLALKLLDAMAFPEALIVNRSTSTFEGYLSERQCRLSEIKNKPY